MAEFSLKDTLLFGGLLLGAGVIIRKIDESPEEVSEEVEFCESCVWVPTSIGTRNFIANCGGCGAERKAPISQFREIVDVESLDAEELDEKVKNLIKVGDMKFREYADGTLERFEALPKGFKLGTSVMPVQYRLDKKRELGYSDKLLDAREARNMKMTDKQQLEVADSLSEGDMIQIIVWLSLGGGVYELQSRKVAKIETKKLHKKFSFLETEVPKGWAEKVIILDMGGRIIVSSNFPHILYYEPPFPSLQKVVNKSGSLLSIEKIDGVEAESFDAEQVDYDVLLDGELAGIHESLESAKEAAEKLYVENGKSLGVEVLQMKYDDETLEGDVNGEQVFKLGAESFDAESVSDLKLQKDSCCCGATKKTPCVCMILGSDCSAKKPMCACYRLKAIQQKDEKGAENFEEYEVLVSNNNMEFGLSHNTFRDKEEALDAALKLSQEQTDKFIYVRRDDGKVIRVFRPNHGYGAESRPASYMVKSDAHKLKEASKRIHEKADEHQKYPEWWKSKLSVSRNNADQLADFLDYAVIEGVFESEQHGDDEDDHEEIDELIEKLNTVVDFAITFIHDGGYGGEPKGTFVDTELGIKTEVIEYVEGSIQLRLVRDIDTDELLSVRFSLSGEPEETPIVYLPLPERLTLIPEDERSSK